MRTRRHNRAFTVTEILVAVTIVGILSAAGLVNYSISVRREQWDSARDTLLTIFAGEETYFALNSRIRYYPGAAVGGTACALNGGYTACLGRCNVLASRAACVQAWRNITMDDPHPFDANNPAAVPSVIYEIDARANGFRAQATYNGQDLIIDETRTFSGTWTRP